MLRMLSRDRLGGAGFRRGDHSGSRPDSMFLTRCAANVSHASAIANMVRFASGSLNVSASSRHLSAFSRYWSTRSGMRPVPTVRNTPRWQRRTNKLVPRPLTPRVRHRSVCPSPIRDEARRIATNIAKLPGPALLSEAAAGLGRFKGVLKVLGRRFRPRSLWVHFDPDKSATKRFWGP